MSFYFEDQIHIDCIRNALWNSGEYGQAAVMIGAGFSMNARPVTPSTKPFPSWWQLTEILHDELYQSEENEAAKIAAITQTLRLTQEYESAFGRHALEKRLESLVPDNHYEPSGLHELLLSLPWADVLTTNWDTLIERSARKVLNRRYTTVRTIQDIPGSKQPRIIKLHGSFPSHRPYILTEEDFRTYPTNFRPFVNLARQSIMENVFCLIGFSGDDPNFLHWIGWVRDNLGSSVRKIYLCGLLNLPSVKKKLLYEKNIIPVDLAPVFPATQWPNRQSRYYKALEWLLLNLQAGATSNPLDWPQLSLPLIAPHPADLPPVPAQTQGLPVEERYHP